MADIQFGTRRQTYSVNVLINRLSTRAKILTYDMTSRLGRYPDAADFKSAFEDEVHKMAKEEFDTKGNR